MNIIKTTLLLSVIIFPLLSFTQDSTKINIDKKKKYLYWLNLYGYVKTLTERSYSATSYQDKIQKGKLTSKAIYNFNTLGNILDKQKFDGDTIHPEIESIKRDNKGHIFEWNTYYKDGSLHETSTFKYDDAGYKIESTWDILDHHQKVPRLPQYTFKETNDERGNNIIHEVWIPDFKEDKLTLVNKWTYKYDKKNNKIEETYIFDSIVEDKKIYKYDSLGNQIEIDSYQGSGELTNKEITEYDINGNVVKISKFYSDGSLISRSEYDGKGNEIADLRFDSKGFVSYKITRKYEYDDKGNWTVSYIYVNDIIQRINVRDFIYY